MDNISDKIKEYEEIAERRAEIRKGFLAERDQQQARRERLEKEALPIVKPIVEAIKTEQKSSPTPLTQSEVSRLVTQIDPDDFTRGRKIFVSTVREMYSDSELFNTLLSMVKLNKLTEFSIKKMRQFGVVESLLFYGQGGENLDLLPARQEGSDFKNSMKEFIDFYNINSEVIKRSLRKKRKGMILRESIVETERTVVQ